MGTNARQVWSEIEWTTSDASVLSLKQEEYTGITTPLTGKVTPQEFDKEVTVTATFKANENILNSYTERPADMGTITKSFTVTVKGTGIHEYTEAELKAVLDQYYTADMLQSFEDKKPLDRDNCKGDIQLPRYTKITDAEGNLVFENKEIAVTSSDESVIKINGYRAIVDRFQSGDKDVNLTVTFTRNGTSVSTVIPVKVIAVDESELDAELAKMELAKENYFKGLNDGRYASEAEITGDLHAFQEMNVDEEGNISWVYNYDEMTNTGIIPDGYFEDSWEMEAAGYNKFKTSDNSVLAYENLVYTAPAQDTDVTITSWLSSEKFGDFAPAHPENEKLQKLYKQEVSVKVTVLAPHTHMLIHYAAKDPSYSAAGNTEYWECKDCGKCFSDEAATARIEKADTVIAKLVREAAKEGTVFKAGANYYQVAASTGGTPVVYLKSTTAKKKCTVPATITSNSVTYKVIGISSGAFKGKKKLRTIYIKNKNLTKASVKGSLKGSKVRTVKIKVGSKALNKNYVKRYKPFFAKSNSGKKVRVRR
ncbi:MAG: hypothetical protein Q4D99_04320 [Bacillota bacterium]|nr:hypothetical protein [Bacillota bacterium]